MNLPIRTVDQMTATTDLPSPSQHPAPDGQTIPPLPLDLLAGGETHPGQVRPLQDNVLLYLKPRPERLAGSVIALPANRGKRSNGAREAIVLASGPGHRLRNGTGPLVPTGVEPGQVVVVDELAGQDWALNPSKPRTNPRGCAWGSFPVPTALERPGGEYRMVRADEILMQLVDKRPEDEATELDYGVREGRR